MKKKYQILSMALLLSDSLFAHSNISNAHMGMIDIADKVHDSTPFKGKINKVYKAVEDGDFLKAKPNEGNKPKGSLGIISSV